MNGTLSPSQRLEGALAYPTVGETALKKEVEAIAAAKLAAQTFAKLLRDRRNGVVS